MDNRSHRWANRQILWGWAFLIAIVLLFIYLLFAQGWPRLSTLVAPAADPGSAQPSPEVTSPSPAETPTPAFATPLAQAEATLSSAAQKPVNSAEDVRFAAETVIAVTAESKLAAVVTPAPIRPKPTLEQPAEEAAPEPPELVWLDWIVGAISALTAVVTFIGLVLSSVMKWREDLDDGGHAAKDFEREKFEFELAKQRFELDRAKAEMEQQELELDLARERLALAELRQKYGEHADDPDHQATEPDA